MNISSIEEKEEKEGRRRNSRKEERTLTFLLRLHLLPLSLPQLPLFSSPVSPLDPAPGMYLTSLFASIRLNFMAKAVSSVFLSFSVGFINS